MTDDYDHYAEAQRVASGMRLEGFEDHAEAVEDAIAAGFTSTEFLMALRWHLDIFLRSKPAGSKALRSSAKGLRKQIDKILR